jgi:ABC-type lipoprotein export system ATPase subunit
MHHTPSELSGGQQQRVAIARALVNDPELILADEPTGNLDGQSANELMSLFHGLNRQGRTIVLVTHDAALAAQCRRTVRLTSGHLEELS